MRIPSNCETASELLSTGTWMRLPEKLVFRWRSDEHERGTSSWSCFLSRGGKSGLSFRPSPRYEGPSPYRPFRAVCDSQFIVDSRKIEVKRGTYPSTDYSACYSRPFSSRVLCKTTWNRPLLTRSVQRSISIDFYPWISRNLKKSPTPYILFFSKISTNIYSINLKV